MRWRPAVVPVKETSAGENIHERRSTARTHVSSAILGVSPNSVRWVLHSALQQSTTSFLTAAVLVYTTGAGITAAAGTRLAHQLILAVRFGYHPSRTCLGLLPLQVAIPLRCLKYMRLHWAICTPAAILGCGSRFSGFLSGVEPWLPVTRQCHLEALPQSRQLMGQIFLRGCRSEPLPCDVRYNPLASPATEPVRALVSNSVDHDATPVSVECGQWLHKASTDYPSLST